MHLVQILLPLLDREKRPHHSEHVREIAALLTEKFGGLTAHTRAPAQGLWLESDAGSSPVKDDVIILEVMVAELDRTWWKPFRRELELRFQQEEIVIRAVPIEKL